MKSFMKKALFSLLMMALCLGGVAFWKQEAKAAENNYVTVLNTFNEDQAPVATAGQPISRSFTIPSNGDLVIGVYTAEWCNFSYTISRSNGTLVYGPKNVTASDAAWGYVSSGKALYTIAFTDVTPGTYSISLTFGETQEIDLVGVFEPVIIKPSLDTKSLVVTQGFKDKVSVINAGGAKLTYSSSNTKVATVDSAGNVKGVKKGTANITVKTSTGDNIGTCKVTVKDNVYSVSKLSVSQAPNYQVSPDIYKVSYDKKGNLIIKMRLINKFGSTAKQLKNLKVTIKNEKNKTIGVYSLKKKNINLRSGKAKAFTFKIKKSKLKIKAKQDLRNMSNPVVKGKFTYSR